MAVYVQSRWDQEAGDTEEWRTAMILLLASLELVAQFLVEQDRGSRGGL